MEEGIKKERTNREFFFPLPRQPTHQHITNLWENHLVIRVGSMVATTSGHMFV